MTVIVKVTIWIRAVVLRASLAASQPNVYMQSQEQCHAILGRQHACTPLVQGLRRYRVAYKEKGIQ